MLFQNTVVANFQVETKLSAQKQESYKKQVDSVYKNFENKLSKFNEEKQIVTIEKVAWKIETILKNKISDRNNFVLSYLNFLLKEKLDFLQSNDDKINLWEILKIEEKNNNTEIVKDKIQEQDIQKTITCESWYINQNWTCIKKEETSINVNVNNQVTTRNCYIDNWQWQETFQNNSWGSCKVLSCNNWYQNENNSCVIKCSSGTHKEWNSCINNIKSCNIENWTWEQIWNGSSFWNCVVKFCNAWYENKNWICEKIKTEIALNINYLWSKILKPDWLVDILEINTSSNININNFKINNMCFLLSWNNQYIFSKWRLKSYNWLWNDSIFNNNKICFWNLELWNDTNLSLYGNKLWEMVKINDLWKKVYVELDKETLKIENVNTKESFWYQDIKINNLNQPQEILYSSISYYLWKLDIIHFFQNSWKPEYKWNYTNMKFIFNSNSDFEWKYEFYIKWVKIFEDNLSLLSLENKAVNILDFLSYEQYWFLDGSIDNLSFKFIPDDKLKTWSINVWLSYFSWYIKDNNGNTYNFNTDEFKKYNNYEFSLTWKDFSY